MSLNKYEQELKEICEQDFQSFVNYVAPYNVKGFCHDELMNFLSSTTSLCKLVLYPRAHRKSFYAAMYVCWRIVKNPAITILYISATAALAESQLRIIKQTLDSSKIRRLWKDLINPEEGKREKWAASEICVDSPLRSAEGTRDATVKAGGLTTNTTGFHCDLIVLDDVVVPDNNNEAGRRLVESSVSQLNSVLNPNGEIIGVGTRYDPKDIYGVFMKTKVEVFNDIGEKVDEKPQWAVLQKAVEVDGEFLWARKRRSDGLYFGFDFKTLAQIKAGYYDKRQFFAQYYNNPNDTSLAKISKDMFSYYNREHLIVRGGTWSIGDTTLNVFAAIDFAYTMNQRSDYTVIVVIGIDSEGNYYVLDIDRFKTDMIKDFYEAIIRVHNKWNIKKLRAEATAAQSLIIKQLKLKFEENNIRISIVEHKPTTNKEERMNAVLRPLYEDGKVFHYRGGNCEILEEELVQISPEHDDIKNALTDAIEIAIKPSASYVNRKVQEVKRKLGRFGGI